MHHPVVDIGQMHGSALARREAALCRPMSSPSTPVIEEPRASVWAMAPIGAEAPVAALHRRGEPGRDRSSARSPGGSSGALDQILEKQIVGAFLDRANLELAAVQGQPRGCVDFIRCFAARDMTAVCCFAKTISPLKFSRKRFRAAQLLAQYLLAIGSSCARKQRDDFAALVGERPNSSSMRAAERPSDAGQ